MSRIGEETLVTRLADSEDNHIDIFDTESMTVEMGIHPPESTALRNPHTEDELYYILSGTGKIRVGDEVYPATPGDVIYVEQGVEHDFFDIEEELQTLIVFAGESDPAAYTVRD